jgi:hypothetical protein
MADRILPVNLVANTLLVTHWIMFLVLLGARD